MEEILDCEETQIGSALMDSCGPLTFLVYLRCMKLADRYYEMRELSHLYLIAATHVQDKRLDRLKHLRNPELQEYNETSLRSPNQKNGNSPAKNA